MHATAPSPINIRCDCTSASALCRRVPVLDAARTGRPCRRYAAPAGRSAALPIGSALFWRLMIRGAVLLAITLGIYRFWLTTDIRRFLWSNTEIDGDTPRIHRHRAELLIGFLIAIAILVPVYVPVLHRRASSSASIGQIVRRLRLRAPDPSRPVRASIAPAAIGSPARSIAASASTRTARPGAMRSARVFWWGMIVLTLGLAYPFAQASLERYKLRNTLLRRPARPFRRLRLAAVRARLLMWLLGGRAARRPRIVWRARRVDWDALANDTGADRTTT